jgi:hypothetical protein
MSDRAMESLIYSSFGRMLTRPHVFDDPAQLATGRTPWELFASRYGFRTLSMCLRR